MTVIEPTIIDGWLYDTETGECIGHVDAKPEFIPRTPEEIDWVLSKIGQAEADIAAIDGNAEVIRARAVLANAEAMKKTAQDRLNWFQKRYAADLQHFAERVLAGQKTKTYKSVCGSIALRTVKGGLRVESEIAAIAFVKQFGLENAVKVTESFLISALTDGEKEAVAMALALRVNDDLAQAFEDKPDTITVKITGGATQQQEK